MIRLRAEIMYFQATGPSNRQIGSAARGRLRLAPGEHALTRHIRVHRKVHKNELFVPAASSILL